MSEWLKKYRENHADFDKGSLNDVGMDPFAAFSLWFDEAVNHGEVEANAFVLSTATADEGVSSRIVYLKEMKDCFSGLDYSGNCASKESLRKSLNRKVMRILLHVLGKVNLVLGHLGNQKPWKEREI